MTFGKEERILYGNRFNGTKGNGYQPIKKVKTNEEWIHSMTTEDLVSFLYRVRFMSESPWQGKTISEWLKEKHSE